MTAVSWSQHKLKAAMVEDLNVKKLFFYLITINESHLWDPQNLHDRHKQGLSYKPEQPAITDSSYSTSKKRQLFFGLDGKWPPSPPIEPAVIQSNGRFSHLVSSWAKAFATGFWSSQACHSCLLKIISRKFPMTSKREKTATFTKLWIVYKSDSMTYTFTIPFL